VEKFQFVPHVRPTPTARNLRNRLSVTPITHRNLVAMINAVGGDDTLTDAQRARDCLLLGLGWETGFPRSQLAKVTIGQVTGTDHPIPTSPSVDLLCQRWLDLLPTLTLDNDQPMEWDLDPDDTIAGDTPLFWSLRYWGTLTGQPMSGDAINDAVQRAVHAAKLRQAPLYSHDSLRLGGELAAEIRALQDVTAAVNRTGQVPDDLRI
jgi:hypothetical protein